MACFLILRNMSAWSIDRDGSATCPPFPKAKSNEIRNATHRLYSINLTTGKSAACKWPLHNGLQSLRLIFVLWTHITFQTSLLGYEVWRSNSLNWRWKVRKSSSLQYLANPKSFNIFYSCSIKWCKAGSGHAEWAPSFQCGVHISRFRYLHSFMRMCYVSRYFRSEWYQVGVSISDVDRSQTI